MENTTAQQFLEIDDLSRFVAPSITYAHVTKWMEDYASVKAKAASSRATFAAIIGQLIGIVIGIIILELWIL